MNAKWRTTASTSSPADLQLINKDIHSTGVFLIAVLALDFGKLASTAVHARVRAWSHEVLVLALHNFRLTVPRRIQLFKILRSWRR